MSTTFLISYTAVDERWAEWIAWELEDKGHRCRLQKWDFAPGSNFVLEMHRAIQESEYTVAVLSRAYLTSKFGAAEWAAAFSPDPTGDRRKLVPVRVEDCERPGLFRNVVSVDLFGQTEDGARKVLLSAVSGQRGKPDARPAFPARAVPADAAQQVRPQFPGPPGRGSEEIELRHVLAALDHIIEGANSVDPPRDIAQRFQRWRETTSQFLSTFTDTASFRASAPKFVESWVLWEAEHCKRWIHTRLLSKGSSHDP